MDDSYSYSTPLNYELHLCKKMRKLAMLMMRHKDNGWNDLQSRSMPPYAVICCTSFRQCSRMSNEDILIYPFSGPDYRYDGGSIYARKMAAKAARPAMAIELPVVLAAPLKAWMGELVGLTALKGCVN